MSDQDPQRYRVRVSREGDSWLAHVSGLEGAHTFARSLTGLDRSVREVIVLAADLSDEAMSDLVLKWDYRTGFPDVDVAAAEVRALRSQADRIAAVATTRTAQAANDLVEHGFSVRDVGAVLGTSAQRVSQLTETPKVG